MNRLPVVVSLLCLGLIPPAARAVETDFDSGYVLPDLPTDTAADQSELYINDGSRVRKFNAALKKLGIPAESAPDFSQFPHAGESSRANFEPESPVLKWLDPSLRLRDYLHLEPTRVSLLRDFYSPQLPAEYQEYEVDVRDSGPSLDNQKLMDELSAIAGQARDPDNRAPLKGLRIAIDPGHMGNDLWDDFTGKYVKIPNKNGTYTRVSEGQLTLWTAFLTANVLTELGATVKLTRADLAPVSKKDFRTYDHRPYLQQYFYDSLDGWMAKYLAKYDEATLVQKIRTLPEARQIPDTKLKTFPATDADRQKLKTHLFITGEDLEARAQVIHNFNPHITIDIHFDASTPDRLQSATNDVEAYVPGNFVPTETGSRKIRALAFRHALEARRWNESVNLASVVTSAMSQSLGIKQMQIPELKIKGSVVGRKVKDGVYARNLYLTRRNLKGLIVYLECLHYDHTSEFYRLSNKNKSSIFQGLPFTYPGRLDQVTQGIRDGLLQYFRTLAEEPGQFSL